MFWYIVLALIAAVGAYGLYYLVTWNHGRRYLQQHGPAVDPPEYELTVNPPQHAPAVQPLQDVPAVQQGPAPAAIQEAPEVNDLASYSLQQYLAVEPPEHEVRAQLVQVFDALPPAQEEPDPPSNEA